MKKLYFLLVLFFLALNINAQIPTDSLVGYWPFNGNANDESGNGYNGIVNGATLTIDRFGNSNSAFSFDGTSNNFITVDFSIPLNTSEYSGITISAWCNLNDLASPHNILTLHDNSYIGSFSMPYDYSVQKFYGLKYSGNPAVATLNPVNSNNWYNVVITFDTITHIFKLYLNNVFQGEATYNEYMPLASKLYVGYHNSDSWGYGWYMNGIIDDIRIYNRVLDSTEISNLYYENYCFETVYDTITIYDTVSYSSSYINYNEQIITSPFDDQGDAAAIYENIAVIGRAWEDKQSISSSGATYVYEYNGTNWTQKQKIIPSEGKENYN
ncbi:hypothetical protein ES705_23329 [subsurface metagenome]